MTFALALILLAQQPPAVEALLRSTLRLVGRFSAAHACPVGPRLALTNGHVIDPRPFDSGVGLSPFAWSDGTGASGFADPIGVESARDLARIKPNGEEVFPHYLPVASEAPKPGDRVWILGYSWQNKKAAMADDVIEAKVTRIIALHVQFYPSGQGGSSGSCMVNEAGEVVAINEAGWPTDDGESGGQAVGVWGKYLEKPK